MTSSTCFEPDGSKHVEDVKKLKDGCIYNIYSRKGRFESVVYLDLWLALTLGRVALAFDLMVLTFDLMVLTFDLESLLSRNASTDWYWY